MAVATGSKSDWEKIVHSEHIRKWLEQSKSLRILITGKTGAGKSALVNGIVGKYVAKEGETLDPETSTVVEYRTTIQDVEVVIYDSPGLQDGTSKEEAGSAILEACLLYTSPSPRDATLSRMPSSA